MARETVRFGVDLERKVEGEFADIAEQVERRPKVDFHRVLINRVVRLWKEQPQKLEDIGLIRRGY
jgi:hypothetical protein